jgi:AcrR family transcriptional regulator
MGSRNDQGRRGAVSHKQKRATFTRRQLLRSARTIFAHDGFELARIEEISAKAGKNTRCILRSLWR